MLAHLKMAKCCWRLWKDWTKIKWRNDVDENLHFCFTACLNTNGSLHHVFVCIFVESLIFTFLCGHCWMCFEELCKLETQQQIFWVESANVRDWLPWLDWVSEWEGSAFCEKQWERRKLPGEEERGWTNLGFSKVFPIFSFSILTIWQSRKAYYKLQIFLSCCIQCTKSVWVIYLFGPKTRFCHVTYILTCISFVGPFQIWFLHLSLGKLIGFQWAIFRSSMWG